LNLLRHPVVLPLSIGIIALTCAFPEHIGWKTSFLLLSLRSAVVPAMILATLSNPAGALSRILEFKTLRFVGLISSSLYLWQELFLPSDPLKGLTAVQWFPLNVALAFACAILSFYLVETPMIRLEQRIGGRRMNFVERTAAI
jgi:peptidoglycan/LPS O-acetylase OafA/YrhL